MVRGVPLGKPGGKRRSPLHHPTRSLRPIGLLDRIPSDQSLCLKNPIHSLLSSAGRLCHYSRNRLPMPSRLARNIPLFIAFRVLFNARWYYPVMSVLFLDFGLTIEQFALLNVAWAAAIVGLEVPSGALADAWGRRRLVVGAAVLMVVEMSVFSFAPRGNPGLLFALLLMNRILSGAAEASASGADEALAYDSLAAEGRESEWPRVLARVMRWQSLGFFAAMMLGAAIYDPALVQRVLDALGLPWHATREVTMRLPIYFTLANAVLALFVTLQMREPPATIKANVEGQVSDDEAPSSVAGKEGGMRASRISSPVTIEPAAPSLAGAPSSDHSTAEAPHVAAPASASTGAAATWRATLAAGRWILATPVALRIILAGLCFDSIARLFLTMGSNYYRLIGLPDATFGLIGSGFAVLGFFVPALANRLVARGTPGTNFSLVAALVLVSLIGIACIWPLFGLLWLIPLGVAMSLTGFFVSHYLNEAVTDSRQRATVLSFRGLAFNLAYGGIGLLFAALSRALQHHGPPEAVFAESLGWLPWYFAATLMLLTFAWRRLRR